MERKSPASHHIDLESEDPELFALLNAPACTSTQREPDRKGKQWTSLKRSLPPYVAPATKVTDSPANAKRKAVTEAFNRTPAFPETLKSKDIRPGSVFPVINIKNIVTGRFGPKLVFTLMCEDGEPRDLFLPSRYKMTDADIETLLTDPVTLLFEGKDAASGCLKYKILTD